MAVTALGTTLWALALPAQLPDARWSAHAAAALAPAAQRDQALSPLRFGGLGGGGELAASARRGRLRLGARAALAAATLRPAARPVGTADRTAVSASAQLTALTPVAAWRGARLLAGAAVDAQLFEAGDDVVLPELGVTNTPVARTAALTLRPAVQLEGAVRRTAVAYALAPAAAGWLWRRDALGIDAARGAPAGPGRLGALEQSVRLARAVHPRVAVAAGYRAAVWRVRGPGDAAPFTALDQRVTLGLTLRARGGGP